MKPVPSYPAYQVSRSGHVMGLYGRPMLGFQDSNGYRLVDLATEDGRKRYLLHRLILETFVGPCPPGMECRHLNGDKDDNRLENLAWGTRSENMQDKIKHGTIIRGDKHPASKLVPLQVRVIWRLRGRLSTEVVGRIFGVAGETIRGIWIRRGWRWLTCDLDEALAISIRYCGTP